MSISKNSTNNSTPPEADLAPLTGGITGSVSSTLIGLAIGGPIGAAFGAISGPVVSFAVEAMARRRARAQAIVADAAIRSGEEIDEFVKGLLESGELTDLAAQIISVAANTPFTLKLQALSALLAEAKGSAPRGLENAFILTRIIDSLEPVHLNVLSAVRTFNSSKPDAHGCTPDFLIESFPDQKHLLRSVVRTLELHGLLVDQARLAPLDHGGHVYWASSEIGDALVDIVDTCTRGATEEHLHE